ncbi:MAG: substrate-binding domain-containing protein [Bradyrhizobium sp.]|uniref:phosphate ABC transporter substrate-binding/OmpA family protein n=1 Tax=Bradyrhizobium sp. TaxID=376 RepID=UPI001D2A55B8|nr:phosphate ABC transporter substrate-binding/OmpA family protein [Bradyrhizobium sp.]MBV9564923.1 substrate-binding domain-containing protein [Bradyrhizobium sp.]
MRSSFPTRTMILALLSVWFLVRFLGEPSQAQNPIGLKVMFCSKVNANAPPISGTLVGNDSTTYYRVYTENYGEITVRRADVEECGSHVVCPARQEAGPAGCACPASQVMQDGHCVSPAPRPVVANTTPDPAAPAAPCRSFEDLAIQGSGTVGLGVMPFLIQAFANANAMRVAPTDDPKTLTRIYQLQGSSPDAACFRVTVRSTGSDTAKDAIVDKVAKIGMSSRDYSASEIGVLASAAGRTPLVRSEVEQVVALDAVVVVVNRQNPVGALSLCQIAQIFAGRIRDWRELGGRPGTINLQVRLGPSGTFETFQSLVLKTCGAELARTIAFTHGSYDRLLAAVASDEMSIGFAPEALIGKNVKPLRLRGACGVEQSASSFSIKTEDYPLARRLFIFTPYPLEGYARRLVDFIKADDRADDAFGLSLPAVGEDGAEVPHSATDQKIEIARDDHAESARLQETEADPIARRRFVETAAQADRLSITYRFAFGSEDLDTKARQDIQRFARYLQKNPTSRNVLLAGFTDNVGNETANVDLARKRAEAVRRELAALGAWRYARDIQVEGFGKILPVACNDTELGRQKNRRVEVFLGR